MIYYFDTSALLKLVKTEKETAALLAWREALDDDAELVTSELSELEITRTLLRGRVDRTQVPYYMKRAVAGLFITILQPIHFARAKAYEATRLGSLDAIHLATVEPLRAHLAALVTYDQELAAAARALDLPVSGPA